MNDQAQTEPLDNNAEPQFNAIEAAKLINSEEVIEYFKTIFGDVGWNHERHICLRGIGEKGTKQEGIFRSDNFFEPSMADPTDGILNCVQLWARNQIACFVVPAVLRAAKGTAENVSLFTNILADLDSGNTDEKLAHMRQHIGEPTMIVKSGGTTSEGTPKRHVYYVLSSPTENIKRAILTRDMLARKCGGDISMGLGVDGNPFGRAHQPVRVAGSVHAKKGIAAACSIESNCGQKYDFDSLEKLISEMESGPWVVETPQTGKPMMTDSLFSPSSGGTTAADSLRTPVYEGGENRTRWGEFNKVAGLHISMSRRGEMSIQEAYDRTHGWCIAYMNPPWPENRIEHEFSSLVSHDIRQHGPMPEPEKPIVQEEQRMSAGGLGLRIWAAHRWITEPKPEHSFLVEDLVIKAEPHLFVAQGGAGKTFQVADLALKIASFDKDSPSFWCGQKVVQGGTAVLILCEDSQTEMHRRLLEINSDSRIEKAGDKLIILPMTKLGGAFPLVEIDYRSGESRPSKRWAEMLALLKELPDLAMVCIDTLNSVSHGDENSALAISQMMREAHRVCGELGAALVVNHHIRKTSKDQKITSLEDLSAAIRGSSAISSYFRINFGMFACGDYVRRMKSMGLKPENGALWRFGVAKANIHGLMRGEKTLLRNKRGLMDDVTKLDMFAGDTYQERVGWLVAACRIAAERGHPYTTGAKNAANGLYRRRAELPPTLRHLGEHELPKLLSAAMEDGLLVGCSVRGSRSKQYLDAPSGRLASDEAGAEINSGAYTDMPDWSVYAYCDAQRAVVKRDEVVKPFSAT
jgi:hypothetical protein